MLMARPTPLGKVQARLAAAQLGLVGDVVVDERRRVEVLDGRGGRVARAQVAAHGHGRPRSR